MSLFAILLACSSGTTADPAKPAAKPAAEQAAPAAQGKREDTDIATLEKVLADGALVIDVRTDGEWQQGHVPGAVHTPMPVSPDNPVLQKHDKSQPVYVICESGGRSARTADALAGAGYHAVNVMGGTGAWRNAGKPLSND